MTPSWAGFLSPPWQDDVVPAAAIHPRLRLGTTELLVGILIVVALSGRALHDFVTRGPKLATAGTVFCGVFVEALPFLTLGVVLSGLIAVFVSPERLARWLPRRPTAAMPRVLAVPHCRDANAGQSRWRGGSSATGRRAQRR